MTGVLKRRSCKGTGTFREALVMTEAKTGVMLPQIKECQCPPTARKSMDIPFRRNMGLPPLILESTERENKFLLF